MADIGLNRLASPVRQIAVVVTLVIASCVLAASAPGANAHPIQHSRSAQVGLAHRFGHHPRSGRSRARRLRADIDRDGLRTVTELRRTKTRPHKYDTDNDGYGDGIEVTAGSDPLDPTSTPNTLINRGQPASVSQRHSVPRSDEGPAAAEEGGKETPEDPSEEEAPTGGEDNSIGPPPAPACTQTVTGNLSQAITSAAPDSVLCLDGGTGSFALSQVNKTNVTVEGPGTLTYSTLTNSSGINLVGLHFTDGLELLDSTHDVLITDNEFTGRFGMRANGNKALQGTYVSNVAFERNYLHDLDFTGYDGTANGYGMTLINGIQHFRIVGNTIKSVAIDYIQLGRPSDFVIAHNTFLGPTLRGNHPGVHQDLLQVFGGGENVVYRDNVALDTGTNESLLFQEGKFSDVTIENNLLVNDSDGYSCQIFQVEGLTFRYNTIVDSRWGCLFRDLSSAPPGSGYRVDHNVVVGTEENKDFGFAGRAGEWGTYDWNVSGDTSAPGPNSTRDWQPSWASGSSFEPLGIPFVTGYLPAL